jgi:hypothetical protein
VEMVFLSNHCGEGKIYDILRRGMTTHVKYYKLLQGVPMTMAPCVSLVQELVLEQEFPCKVFFVLFIFWRPHCGCKLVGHEIKSLKL